MREKVVTYPMLGKQAAFAAEITDFGFFRNDMFIGITITVVKAFANIDFS